MKKIILIFLVLVILAGIGFSVWYFKLYKLIVKQESLSSPLPSPQEQKIATKNWEDPAGFAFDYNEVFEVDSHPDDEENYANLTLTAPGMEGQIDILVSDFTKETLTEDELVKAGSPLDTKVASVSAKKVAADNKLAVIFLDSENVRYLIETTPANNPFWQKNIQVVLDSFRFIPYEGEEEDSSRLYIPVEDYTGEDDGNVIYESTEVIE